MAEPIGINQRDWMSLEEAADEIGITYHALNSRIYKGNVDPDSTDRWGGGRFIKKTEVERLKDARNRRLEQSTR